MVLTVDVPGMEEVVLMGLLDTVDKVCPYSNAVRGNVSVEIRIGKAFVENRPPVWTGS